jgi:hypothetical protein
VRCILFPGTMPVEIQVLQDRDVVLTEFFQEEWLAENWARAYNDRLKQQGWRDSSTSAAPDRGARASSENDRRN